MDAFLHTVLSVYTLIPALLMLVLDGVIDRQINHLSVPETIGLQLKSYFWSIPLAILAAGATIFMADFMSELGQKLYITVFCVFNLQIALFFKKKISDMGEDGDYSSAKALKTGLLLIALVGLWVTY